MIRVSKLTDYGVALLSRIARSARGSIHNARELSGGTGVPLPMVSKILKILARESLLVSHRGTKGGYSLSRPPEDVSLPEMIAALEGPISMTQCVSVSGSDCDRRAACRMCGGWEMVNEAILRALEGISLATMCERDYPSFFQTVAAGAPGTVSETPDEEFGS